MSVNVRCEVSVLEVDGQPANISTKLYIKSHWVYNDRVVLSLPHSDVSVTVTIADLLRALRSAGP
jgi:hypothetical protein